MLVRLALCILGSWIHDETFRARHYKRHTYTTRRFGTYRTRNAMQFSNNQMRGIRFVSQFRGVFTMANGIYFNIIFLLSSHVRRRRRISLVEVWNLNLNDKVNQNNLHVKHSIWYVRWKQNYSHARKSLYRIHRRLILLPLVEGRNEDNRITYKFSRNCSEGQRHSDD